MEIFPYIPRGEQEQLIEFLRKAAAERKHAVIESGTGTGKTICSLTGVIEDQPYHGYKIVYLTRTKSQQKQVMSELREINKKRKVFGVAIQGRSVSTCPMMAKDPELSSGTPDELSRWCSEYKKKKGKTGGCSFFAEIDRINPDMIIRKMREDLPDPESFNKYCLDKGLCPYEMTKLALQYADVICAPYSFLLTPPARKPFLEWINAPLNELVVIVDEAHNIPDYLREVVTSEYTMHALDYAEKEAREWSDPEVYDGLRVTDVIEAMRVCFREAIKEYLIDEDGLIPPYFIEEELMSRLTLTSVALNKIFKILIELGEIVVDKKRSLKKLPRSYMRSLGAFLQFWSMCDDECYVKLINGGDNPSLEAYCMDPYVAAEPFRECRTSIHMSGTLEPLEEYAQELGLQNTVMRSFFSPFNPDNLLSLYTPDTTTKHDDLMKDKEMYSLLEDRTVSIATCVCRNTAVFFSSYAMMDRFIADGVPDRFGREVYYEKRGMSQNDLMEAVDSFRLSEGSVLFAVAGGRISEGLDFPNKDLEVAIIVGIPYPFPNVKQKALIRYADLRFGNGWDHVVKSPTVRKMRQARGRLIRSETDRGACVVLDRRVASINGFDAEETDFPTSVISNFFGE